MRNKRASAAIGAAAGGSSIICAMSISDGVTAGLCAPWGYGYAGRLPGRKSSACGEAAEVRRNACEQAQERRNAGTQALR